VLSTLKDRFARHQADALMTGMVFIWGFHFIVVKDAVANIPPLTYNALRFLIALPIILLMAWYERHALIFSRRDLLLTALLSLIGPFVYQIGFALGIKLTTSTNTALLVATLPTWTAVISMGIGQVQIRAWLIVGIGITLAGVVLVVLSGAASGLSISHDDLVGGALILGATIASAIGNIASKPLVDRVGGVPLAIWKFGLTAVGLTVIALPDLLTLSGDDLPPALLPNVLYSGWLAGLGGFVLGQYALRVMDPTRSAMFFNFTPIVAAFAGIVIVGEPFSWWLLGGGALTLAGVVVTRRHLFLRRKKPKNK
jgi:drug/metabolite transporter (DMT)-like permease